MKKTTTIYVIILSIFLLFTVVGCGQKESVGVSAGVEATAVSALTWQEQYDLGMRYLSEGNYEEAIIAFTLAIEIEPKESIIYLGRAEAYMNYVELSGAVSLAQVDYEKAIELDASNPEAYLGLAEVCIARGEFDMAKEILLAGLEQNPDAWELLERLEELESEEFSDFWGDECKVSGYDDEGNLAWYHLYTYLAVDKMDTATAYDASGMQFDFIQCEYDTEGRELVSMSSYEIESGIFEESVYTYSANGYTATYTFAGMEIYEVCEYDAFGNVHSMEEYEDGVFSRRLVYEYNTNGDMTRISNYSLDGELTTWSTYDYDENDNLIKQAYYDADGTIGSWEEYGYDENGNMVSSIYYLIDGTIYHWREWVYDDGNLTQSISYNADGTIKSVREYD